MTTVCADKEFDALFGEMGKGFVLNVRDPIVDKIEINTDPLGEGFLNQPECCLRIWMFTVGGKE